MMRQIIFSLLLLLYGNCFAQITGRFRIQQYSTEEGLPSNGIKGLEWDEKNGFLWIGTEAGIVRFNGIDFRIFSKQNLSALNPDRISYLLKDSEGHVHAFNQTGKYFTVAANNLVASPQAALWKGHSVAGLSAATKARIERMATKAGIAVLPNIFALGNTGCVLTGIMNNVYKVCADTTAIPLLMGKAAKELFETGGQIFLLSNSNTIHAINDSGIVKAALPITDQNKQAVAITAATRLIWQYGMRCPILFLDQKAWLLEYVDNGFKVREVCDKVPTNSLLRFAQYDDKGRTLFIGTESKGIIVVRENRVLPVKKTASNINERTAYYAQIKLSNNAVLTNEGHVLGTGQGIVSPINGKFSLRISASGDSVVWYTQFVAGKNMLFKLNLITGHKQMCKGKLLSPSVSVATVGNKVFAATLAGIALLQQDSMQYVYRYTTALPGTHEPLDMLLYEGKWLVFANCSSLLRFDTETYRLDTLFTLHDYCIRTLKLYNGYFLLGTYGGGFYIYRNGVCKPMPLDKNQFLLYTHCFVPDAAGFCWMSTNRGLFKAKMQDLLDAFEKNTPQVYYHYLGRNDGMDITEMNGGCSPCAIALNANTLSFPTMDGLLWVNTDTNHFLLPEGPLFIDRITVNNKEMPYTAAALDFAPNTKEIQIALGFPAWCNQENIYLSYRLNEDDPWLPVEIKNSPVIKLSNVQPGSYHLQVRKMNGFGGDHYSYKTIHFSIAAPWHKRWWFYLLLATGATGLFVFIYRVRTRQLIRNQLKLENQVAEKTKELRQNNIALEKNNSINTRLISIISHDIVTPLKFLNVAGKNLLEKKDLMPEALKDETIKEITNTSKELQLLSTNILNWIKYQNENRRLVKEQFNLHELVNQSLSVLQSLAKQKHIAIDNTVPVDSMAWQYLEPLKILVYNLVTNAINFSEGGQITIGAKRHGNLLTLMVKDEGAGMTAEQINNIMKEQVIVSSANKDNRKGNGLGYLIIKDLLKTMNATLDIQSTVNMGTTVLVTVPIGNNNG